MHPTHVAPGSTGAPPDRTLYAEAGWISPWVFHALVALEEKLLPYRLEVLPLPLPPAARDGLEAAAVLGKVPVLVDGPLAFSESLAISEYLAERYPTPDHPRIFPADLGHRARARQVMSWLRTDLHALREARPTTAVFGPPVATPLSPAAMADASTLIRVAQRVLAERPADAGFCIADADLALAVMRLVRSGDPVPADVRGFAEAVWARPSVQVFLRLRAQSEAAAGRPGSTAPPG